MTIFSSVSLFNFEKRLNTVNKDLETAFKVFRNNVLITLFTELLNRTPVDTGLARSNWFFSKRNLVVGILIPIRHPLKQLQQEMAKVEKYEPYANVFINNNVEYIQYLENGSPTTKPTGMLRVSVAKTAAKLRTGIATGPRIGEFFTGFRDPPPEPS